MGIPIPIPMGIPIPIPMGIRIPTADLMADRNGNRFSDGV